MSLEAIREFFASVWGLWLMAVFIGIVVWAFWPRNRKRFEEASRIPLCDDEPRPTESRPGQNGGELERDAGKQ